MTIFRAALAALALATPALPALAQTADMDAAIAGLKLQNVQRHPGQHGPDATGTLPDGQIVALDFERDGRLEEIKTPDGSFAPLTAIGAALPQAVREAPSLSGARFHEVEFDGDGIEIEGRTADDRPFKAEFDRTGTMTEWKID